MKISLQALFPEWGDRFRNCGNPPFIYKDGLGRRHGRMKIIGAARREGIKPSPTSAGVLNKNIFCRGGVYPLPNYNPVFYVTPSGSTDE